MAHNGYCPALNGGSCSVGAPKYAIGDTCVIYYSGFGFLRVKVINLKVVNNKWVYDIRFFKDGLIKNDYLEHQLEPITEIMKLLYF